MNFLSACDEMAALVRENIRPLVGSPGGEVIRMGADHTPTEKIDQVAEDCVIGYLREHDLCSVLVSEEAGRVSMDGGKGTIFLDPVDGTYNAVTGIPFYALSLAWAHEGVVQEAFVQDLATGETFTAVPGQICPVQREADPCLHNSPAGQVRDEHLRPEIRSDPDDAARPQDPAVAASWRFRARTLLCGCREDRWVRGSQSTLRVTDAAAGMLICTEAGGTVSDLNGEPLNFPEEVTVGRCIIATNSVLHHKVIEYLR